MASRERGDLPATLTELERKLRDLELELRHAGDADQSPAPVPAPPAPAPAPGPSPPRSRTEELVDEAREQVASLRGRLDELADLRDQLAEAAEALVTDYSRVLDQIAAASRAQAPSPAAAPFAGSFFDGEVSIDVGAFEDIAALADFEQKLRRVPHVRDVRVNGFHSDRALVALALSGPVELVAELQRLSPHGFEVQEDGNARLTLTLRPPPR